MTCCNGCVRVSVCICMCVKCVLLRIDCVSHLQLRMGDMCFFESQPGGTDESICTVRYDHNTIGSGN